MMRLGKKDVLYAPFSIGGLIIVSASAGILSLFFKIWLGYFVSIYWILLQCFVWESIVRYYSRNSKDIDPLSIMGAITFSLVFSLVSFSLLLDMIPENASSNAYIVNDIFSKQECSKIISAAENHAADFGWTTGRHTYYATTDLAVDSILSNISVPVSGSSEAKIIEVDFSAWVGDRIKKAVFPSLVSYYSLPFSTDSLRIQDMFIVKYEAAEDKQVRLQKHIDASLLSFNIALSSHSEGDFDGGGTLFSVSDRPIQLSQGSGLLHPSRMYHEGVAITRGKRFILVGFVLVDGWSWSTVWRKFGTFTRCLNVFEPNSGKPIVDIVIAFRTDFVSIDDASHASDGLKLVSSECRFPLWVYFHDVSEVLLHFIRYNTSYDLLVKVLVLCVVLAALW